MTVWALRSSVFAQMRRQSVTHPSIFAVRSLSKSKTRRRRAGESVLGREADTIGRPTQPPELQNSTPVILCLGVGKTGRQANRERPWEAGLRR